MPYLKPRETPFAEVARLLKGYDLKGPSLAAVLACGEQKARSRLQNPGDLTLAELARICRNAHIPADELRNAIKF